MKKSIETFKTALLSVSEIEDEKQLVQLFELVFSKVTILTTQQMADLEGKSYNGIKKSNRYGKINFNGKRLVVKGVRNDTLPI
tara:strand:- start:797 stop:1045 length:249 start_codon:yes stop_codon:yes gene_type:complete